MFNPVHITLKNFGTHENTTMLFDEVLFILGENMDDSGQESNGSGKTFITEALSYSYRGEGVRGVDDKSLIRHGCDMAEIEIVFRSDKELIINRKIHRKQSQSLSIIYDGKDLSDMFSSINEGNVLIERITGVDRRDFMSFFVINKNKYKSFYSYSDKDKQEVINRFSGCDKIDNIDPLIKSDIGNIQGDIVKLDMLINRKIGSIQRSKELFQECLSHDPRIEYENQINELLGRQLSLSDSTVELENKKVEIIKNSSILKNEIDELMKESNLHSEDLNLMGEEIARISRNKEIFQKEVMELSDKGVILQKNLSKLKSEKLVLESSKKNLSIVLSGSISCPRCSHQWVIDNELSVEDIKSNISNLEIDIARKDVEIKSQQNRISNNENRIKNIEDKIKPFNDEICEIKNILKQVEDCKKLIEQNIKQKQRLIDNFDLELSSIVKSLSLNKKGINELSAKMESIQIPDNSKIENECCSIVSQIQSLGRDKRDRKVLTDKILELQSLIALFKRFKAKLANGSLSMIEGLTNQHLENMGSNIQIQVEGYKVLKSGEIREKINLSILKNGIDFGDFNSLSGGERARVEVATILALQDLINSTSNEGINMLHIDEVLDSTDGLGFSLLGQSLKGSGRFVNLITHIDIKSHGDYLINKIVKKNSISTCQRITN